MTEEETALNEQTPKQIVEELNKYIVGQDKAKRAVAIALRNRWRSRRIDESIREDVIPKNILMIGSTGVGKTEIARRLAKLVKAPFVKVEATKFTEVGYVGRDVESIVRELAEVAVRMVKQQRMEEVQDKAKELAEERILDVFVPEPKKFSNPLGSLFGAAAEVAEKEESGEEPKYKAGRDWCRKRLEAGELEDELIEIDVEDTSRPMIGMLSGSSLENMGDGLQDMISSLMPKKHKKRKVPVKEARKIFTQEEAAKIMQEQSGFIILDVRTAQEFNGGHIPNAINVTNESITDKQPEQLPDKNQMILVYCRSGRRSKQAAQKLVDMGYTNILEFGGINTWQGETTPQ